MFCAAFLSRKTNLPNFSMKIGTLSGLSWLDQSFIISGFFYLNCMIFSGFMAKLLGWK